MAKALKYKELENTSSGLFCRIVPENVIAAQRKNPCQMLPDNIYQTLKIACLSSNYNNYNLPVIAG
jgi:hypothetical protein